MKYLALLLILVLGCKKANNNDASIKQYYFTAETDGQLWHVNKVGEIGFGAIYSEFKKRFQISILANDQDTTTKTSFISISFDFLPKLGRYYFNNNGPQQLDSGIIATYNYRRNGLNTNKWSTSGYVDIDFFTRDEMKGTFWFTSKGDLNDPTLSTTQLGSFYVPYLGGSGSVQWTGP